jgi:hypothetical protein
MAATRTRQPLRWLAALLLVAPILVSQAHAQAAADVASPDAMQRAALAVMDEFMEAFNARDEAAWVDTLHYPHVRIASGTVAVYPDRAAMLAATDLDAFAADNNWDYSAWDDMKVIQSSPEKVHVAVNFTRYDAQGGVIGTYASLYVLENVAGRWGVRARSSFAP